MRAWLLNSRTGGALRGMGLAGEFHGRVIGGVFTGRIRMYLGEVLRQAGVFITGSMLIILGLVFILGLQCGVEGAYGAKTVGAGSSVGAFTALCNLREVIPYAFGYMMAAKVGTGIVAELGSMRISDEIDALEVMGLDAVAYLGSTRLLGCWLVLPFVYMIAIMVGITASYIAVVIQIGQVSAGGYLQLFWMFQSPMDFVFSLAKGMLMATFVVLIGIYYGYHASDGPVGVGRATARSMFANTLGIHVIGLLTTQLFWGSNPRSPIGG
jgi:phospholipid/cholesterol/gamma-HCH transport system permease protein